MSLFFGVDNYIIDLHTLIFGEHYNVLFYLTWFELIFMTTNVYIFFTSSSLHVHK